MRWLSLLFLLLATTAIYGENEGDTDEANETTEEPEEVDNWEDDGVSILTAENFEDFISENEFVLVEFYAPWCGHCKSFAPEYAKVANELEEKSSPIKVVKVDATKDEKYTEKYGLRGYPTLKLFRNGTSSEYFGGKTVGSIIGWLNKKTGPVAVEIKNVEGAEEFIKSQDVVVIGFFSDFESEDAKIFLSAADSIDDFRFGITSNEEVFDKYETESESIILFNNFDDERTVIFEEEVSEKEIQNFVAIHSAPLIIDFNRGFSHIVFNVIKTHLLMFISKKDGHMEKYAQPATDVAKHFRGKVLFVVIDSDVDEHERIMSFFNIRRDEVPTTRLVHFVDDAMKKYKAKDAADLSPQNLRSFIQDGIDGKLNVALLSERLPEDWDKTPIKTLVATNFEEVAFDEKKDVFVAFYSPWSDESKEVLPIFEELGEKYKESDTVLIAKFDATANEFDPKFPKIDLYPTLKLYKKGDNEIFVYTGKKTLDGFVKFIESGGEDVEVEEVEEEDEYEFEEDERSQLKVEL